MISMSGGERLTLACATLVLAGGLAACGEGSTNAGADVAKASPSPTKTRTQQAYSRCSDTGAKRPTLAAGDQGRTLIIDTHSKYGSTDALQCVLTHLGTSEAVKASMNSTTAMMGVQSADEDDLQYKWSYHPDNGVNMVITDSRAT